MAQADKKHFGKELREKVQARALCRRPMERPLGTTKFSPTGTRSSIRRSAAKTVTRSKLNSSRIMRPIADPSGYDTRTSK
jgi:hypothetical protein